MNDEQLKKLPAELFHIPTVRGADVATYNLPGNPQLRFTGEVLADIFLGRITKWNDDRIKTLNPSSNLPDQPILSGASRGRKRHHLHLGGLSLQGQQGMGAEDAGCPGYVELAYAIQSKMPTALVKSHVGKFIEPIIETTTAAAAGAAKNMPGDFRVSITDAPGADAYPIASFTWLLVYKDQPNEAKGRALVKFLWWAIHEGQKYPPTLLYAPLPAPWSPRSRPRSSRSRSPESPCWLPGSAVR